MKIIAQPSGGGSAPNNENVTSAIAATSTSQAAQIRASLDMQRVAHRPNRWWSLYQKVFDAWAGGFHPTIRIATIRDSIGQRFARPYWYGRFGVGGFIARPSDSTGIFVSTSSGTTVSATDFTQFIGGNWWIVPANGTVNYLALDYQTSVAEVYYFAEAGGGTFKLQFDIDANGTWTDIAGATYNTDNGGARALVRATATIESSFAKRYRVRAIGVSGTCLVVGLGATLKSGAGGGNRPGGVVSMDWGIGGSTMANWVAMPEAQFASMVSGYNPDIVFIRNWEAIEGWASDVQTNFPTIVSRLRAVNPRIAIVVSGSHPTNENADCENPLYEHPMDLWMRDYCRANDIEFLDIRKYFPSRSQMVAMGWMTAGDGVHLEATKAERYLDSLIADRLPLIAGTQPVDWLRLGQAMPNPMINGVDTWNTITGRITVSGPSRNIPIYFNLAASDGNFATNYQTPIQCGISRLRNDSPNFWHEGRMGFYSAGNLTMIAGGGRVWIGTGAASTEYGLNKNINGGLVVQSPATNLPTTMLGAIASQTSDILEIRTGMSATADGTKVGGFTATGRFFAVVPSYADDAAANADAALPSGGLYRTTGGGRTVFAKP